mmetsp:Transcript_13348/g.35831  ORF Transcript_13348/g.35831 Transcript_13348/m.35831 type:complete len:205 (-) Transcript_13348:1242-1856(-)
MSEALVTTPERCKPCHASSSKYCPKTHSGVYKGRATWSSPATIIESMRSRPLAWRAAAPDVSTPRSSPTGNSWTSRTAPGSSFFAAAKTSWSIRAVLLCRSRTKVTNAFLYGSRGSKPGASGPFVAVRSPFAMSFKSCASSAERVRSEQARRSSSIVLNTSSNLCLETSVCFMLLTVLGAPEAIGPTSRQPKQCSKSTSVQKPA